MRFSSITLKAGKAHEFFHNDRTHETKHSIFDQSDNEYSASGEEAKKFYQEDTKQMKQLWLDIKERKMPSNTNTLMSAVLNLNKTHTLEDVKRVGEYLEKSLHTRIYQLAVHRDEGYIDKDGKAHINYHAHILMSGISYNPETNTIQSVKRNLLTKTYLRQLQTKTAEILNMPRSYIKTGHRLDTDEYKEFANKNSALVGSNKKLKEENYNLNREINFYMQETLNKNVEISELKEKNEQSRERIIELKNELNDIREQYAVLESRYEKLYQKAMRIIKKLRDKIYAMRHKEELETTLQAQKPKIVFNNFISKNPNGL